MTPSPTPADPGPAGSDPFGVAELRRRVLAAWADTPARFREDANAEEDLVLGGYRDRVVVELAQNAADAAARAGVPGRLRFRLREGVLTADNTGAPLDSDGVQALSTLRASAKRDGASVGRFGVGFAAVVAVTDRPEVASRTGAVLFDAARTRALVADRPSLAAELTRRGGAVPVLRLPFAGMGVVSAGYDTTVRLPLRAGSEAPVRAQLDALNADLLLALPGLAEIDVDGRVLRAVDLSGGLLDLHDGDAVRRWRVHRAAGELSPEVLRGAGVEERGRSHWSLCWAVPLDDRGVVGPLTGRQVVHAPTPSDEPLSLPVRLIATYPLAPDRRHVLPGAVTDLVTRAAAAAYPELLESLGADPRILELVPRPDLGGAELDAALGHAVLRALTDAPWLPTAAGARVPAPRATALDPASEELVEALREVVPGLLTAGWSARTRSRALTALGIPRLGVAALVELVSALQRPPAWWRMLYAALDGLGVIADADALSALPIPLSDGRTAFGGRGLLLTDADVPASSVLGLRIVAAAAAHPLLERLGARPATAASLLADPLVEAAVRRSLDDEDPDPIADAVLALVAASGEGVSTHGWLGELALPDADGGWAAAAELVLPDSGLADVLAAGALGHLDTSAVDRWGPAALTAVGVLATFDVLTVAELTVGDDLDVDGAEDWYDAVLDRLPEASLPPVLRDVRAVRDLELVQDQAWPQALRMLAALPTDVVGPARAVLADGASVPVPSYTAWWLSTHDVVDGRRPDRLRRNGSVELAGLYDEAPAGLPPFLSCPAVLADVLADVDGALDLLDRLADDRRTVDPLVLAEVYPRLAQTLAGVRIDAPDFVRTVHGSVVPGRDAAVLDAPYVLPLLDRAVVPAGGHPAAVAALLDVALASELVRGNVSSTSTRTTEWAGLPGAELAARRLGLAGLPGHVAIHDGLRVDGHPVTWWPAPGADHVEGGAGAAALGRALAWRHGA
ncbi:MAG: hypothetical protein H0T85_00190, partial [Geodermatophilaceae bacterium]|nr:hypothetical protein [Geodermatophilaceae bacterium]